MALKAIAMKLVVMMAAVVVVEVAVTNLQLQLGFVCPPAGKLTELLTSQPLWPQNDTDDSGEGHSVIQRQVGAVASLLSSRLAPVRVHVDYEAERRLVDVLPSITGLMFKSIVISAFGLTGGFQDYYLLLGSAPFGSRTPISAHARWPSFVAGDCRANLENLGDRPKASGMT